MWCVAVRCWLLMYGPKKLHTHTHTHTHMAVRCWLYMVCMRAAKQTAEREAVRGARDWVRAIRAGYNGLKAIVYCYKTIVYW